MYERKNHPLVSRKKFYFRLARSFAITLFIVGASLVIGSAGYHFCEGLAWIDSLHNAALILSGMGPADQLHTVSGKLFSSFYSLYSGLALIAMVAVLFAPVAHRLMHKFHLELEDEDDDK